MAEIIADRVKEVTTSAGTGTLLLQGAPTGFRPFSSVGTIGDTFHGAIVSVNAKGQPTGAWEVGYYTLTSSNGVLRTRIDASSNANQPVDFGSEIKEVFIDVTAKQIEAISTPMYATRRIEYVGGNEVWGFDGAAGTGRVATTAVAAFAAALPSTPPFGVYNEGVAGMRTDALIAGTDGLHPAWSYFCTTESTADIFIISLGIADMAAGRTQQAFRADLESIIQTAQDAGKFVIVEITHKTNLALTSEYGQATYDAATTKGCQIIDQWTHWSDYMTADSVALTTLCPDGVNPNQQFYTMKGQYAAQVFKTLTLPAATPL